MQIAVMIMAAGEGKRFGGCKLLSELDASHSILSHAVEMATASQIGPVFVVTGRWHNEIAKAQRLGLLAQVPLYYCPQWTQGLGSSIAHGTQILAADFDAMMITLADQVALSSQDFKQFAISATPEHIVCARYNNRRGVPALFPASCFSQLTQCAGEHGARHLLRSHSFPVHEILLPHAAYDIDTQEALADWRHRLQR
ncbi:NTP transferase domain-containing protein [Photobacterium sp. TLY01]|uniref:nucleotidyltransferase family protein n=1 Tax=Photobacterium sp. TLY01 TaxID=2907534 RepID=UPI001F1AAA0E|nr:nucleotidyltransferase family protein [Photobacterium sp. TLY01]UIP28790.1 nucleotidyltransferase family protein [Photobacterium sp. TLY01]